ncbi:RNA polymerase subunit sigma [Candidatus Aerophobetes bacterium]|uniref:protein acetyllysine N-acetyltransferase n=1 Tax=Aerophobetes bacterium TaxID=2030807 RepID=A0A662D3M4_UNCAE|nr:MAG: RNA polymerase subunit sigma [Candidatus Aerophobetes bacterium]
MRENAEKCARLIKESKFVVALSGAGISTNAGIPDFRGPKGIYTTGKYDPDKVFEISYFFRDPKPFYDFARDFVKTLKMIKPTFIHYFLVELEKIGRLKGIITQNIDALHQKAGSKNVLELHGSLWRSYCLQCGRQFSYEEMERRIFEEEIPRCKCGGTIKPDIVFFGEAVKHLENAERLVYQSDLLLIIGSSLAIYPAAMLPDIARGKIVVVNKGEVNISPGKVTLFIQEDVDDFFKKVSRFLTLTL